MKLSYCRRTLTYFALWTQLCLSLVRIWMRRYKESQTVVYRSTWSGDLATAPGHLDHTCPIEPFPLSFYLNAEITTHKIRFWSGLRRRIRFMKRRSGALTMAMTILRLSRYFQSYTCSITFGILSVELVTNYENCITFLCLHTFSG